MTEQSLEERAINTIRFLSVDAVQKANSGHPGLPMGAAAPAYVLWTRFLHHNPSDPSWVPNRCEINGRSVNCPTNRLGDETSSRNTRLFIDKDNSMGDRVDRSRYTIPYRINTEYWTESGGTVQKAQASKLRSVPANIATNNDYVLSWQCRGHYFAASTRPQETVATKRYGQRCNR